MQIRSKSRRPQFAAALLGSRPIRRCVVVVIACHGHPLNIKRPHMLPKVRNSADHRPIGRSWFPPIVRRLSRPRRRGISLTLCIYPDGSLPPIGFAPIPILPLAIRAAPTWGVLAARYFPGGPRFSYRIHNGPYSCSNGGGGGSCRNYPLKAEFPKYLRKTISQTK